MYLVKLSSLWMSISLDSNCSSFLKPKPCQERYIHTSEVIFCGVIQILMSETIPEQSWAVICCIEFTSLWVVCLKTNSTRIYLSSKCTQNLPLLTISDEHKDMSSHMWTVSNLIQSKLSAKPCENQGFSRMELQSICQIDRVICSRLQV